MLSRFGFSSAPDADGWIVASAPSTGRFLDVFGEIRLRIDGPGVARMRVQPGAHHRNINDTIHGGFLLALVDQSLFLCPAMLGIAGAIGGLTIDCSTQFLAPVRPDAPVDLVVEVLRETGRMVFMRGMVEQEGTRALSFSGVIRKASR